MNPIEIVSASAGSGKTYKLASVLEEAVRGKEVRPQAIIATTFTNKAAAELRERVRQRLLERGLAAEAQQLNAAIMGTVNSVCGRLVRDFAFYLGISPEVRILDKEMADRTLRRALTGVIDRESDAAIARLTESFYEWNIEAFISDVVELARANGMGPPDLAVSRDRCIVELNEILGPPMTRDIGADFERKLQAAIRAFLAYFERKEDDTIKTGKCADIARDFLNIRKSGKIPPWQKWSALSKLDPGKKSLPAVSPIISLAADHIRHPQFQADLQAAVAAVFDTAACALQSYAEYKSERGFIDFVDQECLALELLEKPEVQAHLKGDLDLVLVDEFQDTSPIELAIFLKLAEIAGRSVWIGDQKQSIFGFRGSDPELMNAAIDEILKDRPPETLPKSWRSRPGLVRLTSDLFAAAFPAHGIPEDRVRLEPELTKEPKGLGPFIERWTPVADGRSKKSKAAALAAAIKECLDDPSVRVRDRITRKVRRAEAKDIAILCRQNSTCVLIAQSLAEIGTKSALSRMGLMKTPEARLMLSALRLWSDPKDALSAAEIARMLEHPDHPDRWLEVLLRNPGPDAFKDVPVISRIGAASAAERTHLGVLAVFDRLAELLSVRDLCRRWGNADDRLGNLNMLRSLAVKYAKVASEDGAGMTSAGLSAFLTDLEDSGEDSQAFSPDADAVIISTWHKAKGLEWPIVVLYELDIDFSRPSLKIHVAFDKDRISLTAPLAGRWIRYWPYPYHPRTKPTFHDLTQAHRAFQKLIEIERREELRLLYVGWTRARDRVVLACPEKKLGAGMLAKLQRDGCPLLTEPDEGKAGWVGHELDITRRAPSSMEPNPVQLGAESTYATEGPKGYPPALAWPDLSKKTWEPAEPEILGDPIPLKSQADMINLGSAVHGFLAADCLEYIKSDRLEMAGHLLKRWAVEAALTPADLLEISDRLHRWADKNWPNAKWHREWPILQKLDAGSTMRGVTDLILETSEGFVIIDHKAYPFMGDLSNVQELALADAEQVQVYAGAVHLVGRKKLLGTYIHLPLMGVSVSIAKA